MSKTRPGTARGDLTVSAGRVTLGFIRGDAPNVYAYLANGTAIGTFADRRAASRAVTARAAGQDGGAA